MSSNPIKNKPVVLVVDDDAIQRTLTARALAASEFTVGEAENGQKALSILAELNPDIVLLDINMPVMDGFATCEALRGKPDWRHVPVLMMTGMDDIHSIDRAYEVGATNFVTKSNNWTILRHHIQYMLRASKDTRALAQSEERYALAARGANDGLWDWEVTADRVYYSPRWQEMLGYAAGEIGSGLGEWMDRVHDADRERVRAELEEHIAGESNCFHSEYRIRDNSGEYLWMLCRGTAMFDQHGRAYRMAGSQTDISDRKAFEDQLRFDALHDSLTRLPNRTLFLERVDYCINSLSRRHDYSFAVIFLDLDRFKTINDSLGHGLGDSLLVKVSNRISKCLRSVDTLARMGGDEFTILCDDIEDVAALTRIIERIQRELLLPFDLDGQEVVMTASIGITMSSSEYRTSEEMLRDADTAMYRAKSEGRACYKIFDPAMHLHAVNTLRLEAEMRAALVRDEFEIYYQPIVSIANNELVGFEALLRWNHPDRGVLLPQDFLGLAEETSLIVPIGRWLLAEACRQMRAWQREHPDLERCYVSTNLSSPEFVQPDVVDYVRSALANSELKPECLRLELTENVLIENTEAARLVLAQLIDHGVQLALDDFGTGYSSFNYLHRFPFDCVKIDRSFIKEVDVSGNNKEIVKAIIDLAHSLGLNVVAEGSETSSELATLKDLHCEYSQGHIFARPMRGEDIVGLLASRAADSMALPERTTPLQEAVSGEVDSQDTSRGAVLESRG